MKRDEQEFREELNIQKNQEFKQVMIISDGVLFANKTVDVTDEVLLELQQSLAESNVDQSN